LAPRNRKGNKKLSVSRTVQKESSARMKTRARFGDVIEVPTPRGLAYLQYGSRHLKYGDVIRILPGLFATRPTNLEELVKEAGFFAFYPLALAVTRGLVDVVGNMPIPAGYDRPKNLRYAGVRSNDGRVLTWLITNDDGNYLREKLSPEEKHLPIVRIWNHAMLIHKLVTEWCPEKDA
jgi:hypothetical protein